jgi:hypothetical protein
MAFGFKEYCLNNKSDRLGQYQYLEFQHICSSSNMIPLHADIHLHFDAYEFGIDVNVSLICAPVQAFIHLDCCQ